MEIHHVNDRHEDWSEQNLAAICHYCHLARHPLQPGVAHEDHPLRMMWWPDVPQVTLNTLAWTAVWLAETVADLVEVQASAEETRYNIDPGQAEAHLKSFRAELERREEKAARLTGTWHIDVLFEICNRLSGSDGGHGQQNLRFWPRNAGGPAGGWAIWRAVPHIEEVPARLVVPCLEGLDGAMLTTGGRRWHLVGVEIR